MRKSWFQWQILENIPDANGKNMIEVIYPINLSLSIMAFNSGINSDHYGTGNSAINIFDYDLQKCYVYNDCSQEAHTINAFITIIGA